MEKTITNIRYGFIRKNRYGWDICDDDFWGTGYSRDINHAYLYSSDGFPAKETKYKESFGKHIIQTYLTKSGKYGARCTLCGRTHSGKPKSSPEIAFNNLLQQECSKSYITIELTEIYE